MPLPLVGEVLSVEPEVTDRFDGAAGAVELGVLVLLGLVDGSVGVAGAVVASLWFSGCCWVVLPAAGGVRSSLDWAETKPMVPINAVAAVAAAMYLENAIL